VLLSRILASPQFRRATKLREFLSFVTEQSLKSPSDSISEQQIGRAVFGRPADYSPSEDNVVRAHARQLRIKLGEYFSSTGKEETLLLEIPKGSYVPVFAARPEVLVEAPAKPAPPDARRPFSRRDIVAVAAVALVLVGAIVWLTLQNRALNRKLSTLVEATSGSVPAPLGWVLEPDRSVTVVVADSAYGLMQDLIGHPALLEEYLGSAFWQRLKPTAGGDNDWMLHRLRSRQLTSYADVMLSSKIQNLAGPGANVSIRFARDIRPRQLNSGNFIFLGSAYANPWVALYNPKRNFVIQPSENGRQQNIVNKAPRPGEQPNYVLAGEDGAPGATYGLIAFSPSDGTRGNILIIEGTNMEGTEAAGNLILNQKSALDLLNLAGIKDKSKTHPAFEFLVETRVLAGEPSQTRVLGWRR
jgi:hypothetical protein